MASSKYPLTTELECKREEKLRILFKTRKGQPQLEVIRVKEGCGKVDDEREYSVELENVSDTSQLKELSQRDDVLQVGFVRQQRSWTTLDISRDLFEEYIYSNAVFAAIWRVAFSFGIKSAENEFEHPSIKSIHRYSREMQAACEEYEFTYLVRRVESHGRSDEPLPWSIRQTGVYSKLSIGSGSLEVDSPQTQCPRMTRRSKYLILAPSLALESEINDTTDTDGKQSFWTTEAVNPWNLHKILLSEGASNWGEYLAWIEEQLRELFEKVILTEPGSMREATSSVLDFGVGFADRQSLQQIEDLIIDLQIILPVALDNVCRIKAACWECCQRHCAKLYSDCDCGEIIQEFDETMRELDLQLKRTTLLRERATAVAKLLSDLLDYENATAMRDLARESHLESKSMHYLAERSTKDAAAVKALTVISLIYLPTTIVANFFSTQFIQTSENGQMTVTANAWLLAAIAVPLTAVTIALWILWVRCSKVVVPCQVAQLGKHEVEKRA